MNNEVNSYCLDHLIQEPVRATYTVHLTMPAIHDGWVDVEATSGEEAAKLALDDRFGDVDWAYDHGDRCSVEVCGVECENPPRGCSSCRVSLLCNRLPRNV